MVRLFAFATVLVACFSLAAFAADPWIGKEVFWKSGAKAKVNDGEINIQLVPVPATVGDVKGDWLWLGRAWVRKDDVFLPEQALGYYTDQIREKPSAVQNWNNRGAVWNNRGEFDNALRDYADAMRIDPSDANAYNAAAWLRATCSDERYRDGKKAVRHATTACTLSGWKDSSNIDTLAAAYAEAGDFSSAIKWQEKAIELATKDSDEPDMLIRFGLYTEGKPYREMPKQ